MRMERALFLNGLSEVGDYDEELLEDLGMKFALYEKELFDRTTFLIETLGDLTVVHDPEVARRVASDALKEAEYRWQS
jgi:hypothetical protein